MPFRHFFKNYCSKNKSLGSKDRKILREIFYCIFRSGKFKTLPAEQLFLLANQKGSDEILKNFYLGIEQINQNIDFKYPFRDFLNEDFSCQKYYDSFAKQPLVWVRTREDNMSNFIENKNVLLLEKLKINDKTMAFGFEKINLLGNSNFFEIQDFSSQIASSKIKINEGEKVWDCCSGAGGKSLFLAENFNKIKLYVSDKRSSVLKNLEERFKKNELKLPYYAEIDIEEEIEKLNFGDEKIGFNYFDVIVADVPCSGSGTWAREPENLYFFNEEKLRTFSQKQFQIVKNAFRFLKPGGRFYYITCSVFDNENAKVLQKAVSENLINIVNFEYIKGFERRADNMFWAELGKKN